jgi:hypothetical protein
MPQKRLDGLALFSIEKEEASVIGCNEFIAESAKVKSRKVDFV